MKTIEFLKFHTEAYNFEFALSRLTEELGIRVKAYEEHDTYVLNYDQIESPKAHPIVRECRSLVVNSSCEVVSRSFDRFFNYGEGECEVDFSRSLATEKCDGSLITLYYNRGKGAWHFRTRGTAFAESQMPSGAVFADAIHECIELDPDEMQNAINWGESTSVIFEFISPLNRIVTRYEKPELVLLAVRCNDGTYHPYNNYSNLKTIANVLVSLGFKNVRACKTMPISTVEEVELAVAELKDLQEGFVVVDMVTNARVKLKSPAYVKCHHIRGEGLSPKRAAELVAINEQDEYLAVFPEDTPYFEPYVNALAYLLEEMRSTYGLIMDIESQKEFAQNATKFDYSAILFSSRKKQISTKHAFDETNEKYKVELIMKEVGYANAN